MQNAIRSACALLALSGLVASARTPSAAQDPQDQRPAVTFKTGVDLVAVDASVVDRTGRPVAGLTADDFVLTVDGRPRRLVSAQFIAQTRQFERPVPKDEIFSSNAGASAGRLIMLVVDQVNIRQGSGKVVADAATRFIDRLTPADRVGLTVIPSAGQNVDFTTNHALIKTLLARGVGLATRPVGRLHIGVAEALEVQRNNRLVLDQMIERECVSLARPDGFSDPRRDCELELQNEARTVLAATRFRTDESMVALRHVLGGLAGSLEPKTVVFISEGLVLEDRRAELSWVGPLASAAHASLYVLRLEPTLFDTLERQISATVADDVRLEIEGLETLAGAARGAIFPVTANTDFVFDRLALELSGYYLLSFEPEGSDRDGQTHAIRVSVRRDGVEIRARREFSVDLNRSAMTDEGLLAETLRAHLLATEIPLKITTYTFRDLQGGKLKVMIATEIDSGQNTAIASRWPTRSSTTGASWRRSSSTRPSRRTPRPPAARSGRTPPRCWSTPASTR